jgi:hypothetical protein
MSDPGHRRRSVRYGAQRAAAAIANARGARPATTGCPAAAPTGAGWRAAPRSPRSCVCKSPERRPARAPSRDTDRVAASAPAGLPPATAWHGPDGPGAPSPHLAASAVSRRGDGSALAAAPRWMVCALSGGRRHRGRSRRRRVRRHHGSSRRAVRLGLPRRRVRDTRAARRSAVHCAGTSGGHARVLRGRCRRRPRPGASARGRNRNRNRRPMGARAAGPQPRWRRYLQDTRGPR